MNLYSKKIKSPVGKLTLVANEKKLVAILWEKEKPNRVKLAETQNSPDHPLLLKIEKQLGEYFAGKRKTFDVPVEFHGTDFQNKVWRALTQIPYGETRSYADLAKTVGSPKAVRAVGGANGRNPVSIIVPCHRVIGANGKLTGFAGGMEAKEILLDLEGKNLKK